MHPLVESWQIHNRVDLYLLESVPDQALESRAGAKGRTVAEQFAHIHNVRLMWLKAADPELLASVEKLEKEGLDKDRLAHAMAESGKAISLLLERALAKDGKVKGFKPHATAFVCYLISHESHHRGQIMLGLKLAGFPVDKKVAFGIWEWGTR